MANKETNKLAAWFALPVVRALAALILILVLGAIFNADGSFFRWGTHRDMLRAVSVFGILACGMTLVIITAGIDLSVGSVLGMIAVLFAVFSVQFRWPAYFALPACLIIGALAGMVSGGLISKFRMQPFIVTLAMMVFARGVAKLVTGGQKVSTFVMNDQGIPEEVHVPIFDFLNSKVLGDNVAVVTIVMLLCFFISWIFLSKLRWGRYLYAIGGNEEAARLSGIPVRRVKLAAYGMAGFFSAVAGLCQAAQELQGDPEAGQTYELTAIAMVVIGGTSLAGGRGGIWLTFLGALTIGYLEKILSINAVSEAHRLMLTGAIIVGAVLFQKGRKS